MADAGGAAPAAGSGTAAITGAPAAGGGAPAANPHAWEADLPTTHVDLLKAKGMYDDPVKGRRALVDSYFNANKALSGASDVLIIPGADAKVEDWDKVYSKVRPATPDDYEDVFKMPDGAPTNDNFKKFAKGFLHKAGVPKALVQPLLAEWGKFAIETNTMAEVGQKKMNDDAVTAMKTRLGADVFTAKTALAQNVFKVMQANGSISKETLAAVEANIGAAPLLELMFAIGQGMKEGAVIGNGGNTATPTDPSQMTPEQADAEIQRLTKDADFQKKYTDKRAEGHDVAVERMKMLFEAKVRRAA
jgi:hypothetical protein